MYKGTHTRLTADFSVEIFQAQRDGKITLKGSEGKNPIPRMLQSARLSFRIEGEIKNFPDTNAKRVHHN